MKNNVLSQERRLSMAYDVNRDGFKLRSEAHGINDISQLSLKIALQAYFSTYHAINYNFGTICNNGFDESLKDKIYNRKYYEACSETILHFHHFIELSLKKILESVHKLFVYEVKDIIPLYKMLKNEISEDEFEDTRKNTVGFNETLERVLELIEGNYLPFADFKFIKHNKQHIKDLNT